MGGRNSKSAEEEKRRELEWKHGVLIPPSFGVLSEEPLQCVSSTLACSKSNSGVSPMEGWKKSSVSHDLLEEMMSPGVWLRSGSVLVSYHAANNSNNSNNSTRTSNRYVGSMTASSTFDDSHAQVSLQAGTETVPALTGSLPLASNGQLFGSLNINGQATLACFYTQPLCTHNTNTNYNYNTNQQPNAANPEYYRNDPFAKPQPNHRNTISTSASTSASSNNYKLNIGSWLEGDLRQFDTHKLSNSLTCHLHASAQLSKATLAVEMTAPTSPTTLPSNLSYLASFPLNKSTSTSTQDGHTPPIILSLHHKQRHSSSVRLSQVISFDRYVYNLFEQRSAQIRNTFAWTFQYQQISLQQNNNPKAQVAAGCAWQINRAACVKLISKPNNHLTAALLLKRWSDPNITCSIQFGTTPTSLFAFKGIALQIQTPTPLTQHHYNQQTPSQTNNNHTPATKIILNPPPPLHTQPKQT